MSPLKSNTTALEARGKHNILHKQKVLLMAEDALIETINAKDPAMRSAAINHLVEIQGMNASFAQLLLNRLTIEDKLYTRIEICEALQKGDIAVARLMGSYLGAIGNNQHQILPKAISKKKSYPLPRDIIARTMGKMDKTIEPAIGEILNGDNLTQIKEALDAYGFLIFYNKELTVSNALDALANVYNRFKKDSIICWKIAMCLRSFPQEQSVLILRELALYPEPLIRQEALYSLAILEQPQD